MNDKDRRQAAGTIWGSGDMIVKTRKTGLVKKKRYWRDSAKFQTAKVGRGQQMRFVLFFSGWTVSSVRGKQSDSTGTVVQQKAAYLFGHGSMRTQYVDSYSSV